jgi:hypothetical protein
MSVAVVVSTLRPPAQPASPTICDIFSALSVSSVAPWATHGITSAEPVTYAIFTPTATKESVWMFVQICMKLTYKIDPAFHYIKQVSDFL